MGYWITGVDSPEVKFWMTIEERRDREIEAFRKANPDKPVIFFTGGSSCAFSIDPKTIEKQTGIPCFNLGIPVAAGGEYIIHRAFERIKTGDILVLLLEADLFSRSDGMGSPSPFGARLAHALGSINDANGGQFGRQINLNQKINLMRPGARYTATYLAKAILNKPYRYNTMDWQHHGRLETDYCDQPLTPKKMISHTQISDEALVTLHRIRRYAMNEKVKICYAMPWQLTADEIIEKQRSERRKLSEIIGEVIPVIDDEYHGCHNNPNYFSDTSQHLNHDGALIKSKAIAKSIMLWLEQINW